LKHTQASRKYGLYKHVPGTDTHTPSHTPAVEQIECNGWRALECWAPDSCCALQFQNETGGGKRKEGIFPHLCTLCIPNKD